MNTRLALIIVLALIACSRSRPAALPHVEKPNEHVVTLSLGIARAIIRDYERTGRPNALGPIALEDYNFARELQLDPEYRVIVISQNRGGALMLFRGDGFTQVIESGEIRSASIFDFDEDGVHELIVDECAGGTGILKCNYRIYGVNQSSLVELWKAESYYRDAKLATAVARQGLLRFASSSGGEAQATLIYAHGVVGAGSVQEATFVLRGGVFQKTP